jgi:hypothetical protein
MNFPGKRARLKYIFLGTAVLWLVIIFSDLVTLFMFGFFGNLSWVLEILAVLISTMFIFSLGLLLEDIRKNGNTISLSKRIAFIIIVAIVYEISCYPFARIQVSVDEPCASGDVYDPRCTNTNKEIVYFAPTQKMMEEGLSEYGQTKKLPLATVILGSLPIMSSIVVSPWDSGKKINLGTEDGGRASVVYAYKSYFFDYVSAEEGFEFDSTLTHGPIENPRFYGVTLIIGAAFILKETLLYVLKLLNFITLWVKKKYSRDSVGSL